MSINRKLYILCGGKSRRMGSDKAMLNVGGDSLLERQIRKAKPFFDEIVLLTGRNSYQMDNRQLKDEIEDAGPLAGLLEALKDAASHSMRYVAIIPVDLPGLSESTLKKLSESASADPSDAVLLQAGEDLQPLAGVYSTALRDKLTHYLESGNRMVFGFVNSLNFSTIEVNEKELKNVNRPGDLNV